MQLSEYRNPPPFECTAQGQQLTFLPGGDDRLTALLGMIDGARRSIRMCFYIFAEDTSGARVRDALAAAAKRGVRVNLILDGFGADARKDFFAPMCAAGGTFCCFSPRWSQRYLIRNHQKIVVVDGEQAMIGGFNVEDSYFLPPQANGWNDLGIMLRGSAVSELSRWFDQLDRWTSDPHASWRTIRRMVCGWRAGDGPVRVLIGGPTRGLSTWARCVKMDLRRAHRVDMLMAYFSPAYRSLQRIGRVARRGRARLVMAGKSDNGATIGATRALYDYLLKRGVEIHEFTACKLHTKLIVIDDACYFGSANFDMRSLYLNLEVMLRIEDAALAARLREYVDQQLPGAEQVTPAVQAARRTWLNRLRWRASWFLVAVLDYTVTRRLNLGL